MQCHMNGESNEYLNLFVKICLPSLLTITPTEVSKLREYESSYTFAKAFV